MNIDRLYTLGACREAKEWAAKQTSPQQAWDSCKRGDWMLWLLVRAMPNAGNYVACIRIACDIARSVLHFVPAGEDRPLKAIEAAEAYAANPNADTAKAAKAAANAAYAASYASNAASYAAHAAADAAYAASNAAAYATSNVAFAAADAAYAAADAAYAASNASNAASNAAAKAAYAASYAADADIVRKYFPVVPE
jgi:hypothetical protein